MDSAKPASLLQLLLQLSEHPAATLSGRTAAGYFGPALDGLLSERVLVEEEQADVWPACRDCDCAAGVRLIQKIGERDVAVCPIDSHRDIVLSPNDRRLFTIDERRFARLCLGDDSSAVFELGPGLWARSQQPDEWTLLTFRRAVVEMRELPAVLNASVRNGRRVLVAPKPSAHARLALIAVANLSLRGLEDALRLTDDGVLHLEAYKPQDEAIGPRLSVDFRASSVHVDGCLRHVPPARFKLLRLLVEAWERDEPLLASKIHGEFNGREPKKIVSTLRDDLAKGLPGEAAIRGWVQADRRFPPSYRLQLPREWVEISR